MYGINPICPLNKPPYSDLGDSIMLESATLLLSFSFSAAPMSARPYQVMNPRPRRADTMLNVIATIPLGVNLRSISQILTLDNRGKKNKETSTYPSGNGPGGLFSPVKSSKSSVFPAAFPFVPVPADLHAS